MWAPINKSGSELLLLEDFFFSCVSQSVRSVTHRGPENKPDYTEWQIHTGASKIKLISGDDVAQFCSTELWQLQRFLFQLKHPKHGFRWCIWWLSLLFLSSQKKSVKRKCSNVQRLLQIAMYSGLRRVFTGIFPNVFVFFDKINISLLENHVSVLTLIRRFDLGTVRLWRHRRWGCCRRQDHIDLCLSYKLSPLISADPIDICNKHLESEPIKF